MAFYIDRENIASFIDMKIEAIKLRQKNNKNDRVFEAECFAKVSILETVKQQLNLISGKEM